MRLQEKPMLEQKLQVCEALGNVVGDVCCLCSEDPHELKRELIDKIAPFVIQAGDCDSYASLRQAVIGVLEVCLEQLKNHEGL